MKSVAINGFGTIGKRVADAVAAQDDMKVIGVSKTRPNFEAKTAVEEAGRAISCYTGFLSSLSEAMSNVVVSGQPFDKGDTKVHYDNLSKGAKTLEALTTEMDTALSEIALEIASLEPIVAARDGICAACYYSYY